MTVALIRPYGGLAAGAITAFPPSTEAALIAQGIATNSAAAPSTGAYTTGEFAGRAAIAAGASSVVVTNPNVTAASKIWAVVAQAAADGTLLRVERIVPAAGSFTIYGTANATATTVIDWAIVSCGEAPIQ
jgi:hypothetical protein